LKRKQAKLIIELGKYIGWDAGILAVGIVFGILVGLFFVGRKNGFKPKEVTTQSPKNLPLDKWSEHAND